MGVESWEARELGVESRESRERMRMTEVHIYARNYGGSAEPVLLAIAKRDDAVSLVRSFSELRSSP